MKEEKRYLGLTLVLGLGLLVLLGLAGGARPPAALAQAGTGILRVATTGDDVPGCGSEAAPCRSVQYAVDEALPNEQIRVAAGVYTGVQARPAPPGYDGPTVITQTVYLSKTLALRGGYTLTNWVEPDPEAYPTILDAQGLGRVLVVSGTITPTIEGLRFTGGDATGLGGAPYEDDAGGGVYVYQATAIISGCAIYSNTASTANRGNGGGLFLWSSDATFQDNTVQGNTASTGNEGDGGGLSLRYSDATLQGNRVQDNTASTAGVGYGGGLYLHYSDATLEGNTIINNTASTADDGAGGGLDLYESTATLEGNTIISNTATTTGWGNGGGLYLRYSDAMLRDNMIISNTANTAGVGYGGGLYLGSSDATLEGNTIISNTASTAGDGYGGGLWVLESNTIALINNVIAGNQANEGAGLWLDGPSNGRLLHTTIADNTASDDSGQGVYVGEYTTLAFTNTIISGHDGVGITVTADSTATLEGTLWHGNGADTGGEGTILTGTVNVYGDLAFIDPATGDYHLGYNSAAIDAGIDAGITTDIDGEPRPMGAGYDIGADEFYGPALSVVKEAAPDPVAAGAQLTYTLRLINIGTVSLTATITDILPTHVTPGGVFTWTPATLLPGETWTEAFAVTVETDYTGWLTNVVQVTTEEGALGVYTNTVVVEEAIAGLSIENDSPTVLGSATTLTATVTTGSNVTYTWAFGDGELGSGATVSHVYPEVGIYTAVVTASNGVSELATTTTVTITDVPIEGLVATNDSPTVLGEPTTLTATVTAGSNVTYTWALGDGASGGGAVVTHIYPIVGVYTAVVTASNSASELTATTQVIIIGDDIPIEGLIAVNDGPTVLGNATTLTATVTAGSNVSYTWALGDDTSGSGAVVDHAYPAVGEYMAIVTASNSVSELTATTRVTIAEPGFSIYLPLVVKDH